MKLPLPLFLLLTILTACKKDQSQLVDYRAIGNKFSITWTDADGSEHTEIARGEWNKRILFQVGDRLSLAACTIAYDTTYQTNSQGVVVDTVITSVYNAGVTLWAFKANERRSSIASGGCDTGGQCGSFSATVPE